MKRHRYGVIENDADITRLICRLDDINSQVEGSRGGGLNLEKRIRSSVLSGFSFSLLVVIQLVKLYSGKINAIITTEGWVYSWVSSAYRWNSISCHRIRSPSGVVYKRYERPNTDSWGTPNLSVRTEEVNQSELTGNDPYWDKTEVTQALFLLYQTWIAVCITRSFDRQCRRRLIGPAARQRRIVQSLSIDFSISFWTRRSAMSQLWRFF